MRSMIQKIPQTKRKNIKKVKNKKEDIKGKFIRHKT